MTGAGLSVDHVERFDNGSLAQRLGYLLEHVRPQDQVDDALIDVLLSHRSSAYVHLASPAQHGTTGRYDGRWKVIVNVSDERQFGEVTVR